MTDTDRRKALIATSQSCTCLGWSVLLALGVVGLALYVSPWVASMAVAFVLFAAGIAFSVASR